VAWVVKSVKGNGVLGLCACQGSTVRFLYTFGCPIVNKMSQRPMVSASRHFAHYYSDKVVERTKWSIFVPGAKGGQRWLVPHRLRPTKSTRSAVPSPRCDCGEVVPLCDSFEAKKMQQWPRPNTKREGEAFRFVRLLTPQ
jgi:hypothetical protein